MTAKEFEKIISQSNVAGGEILEIFYSDGTVVEGFLQKLSFDFNTDSHHINLCKSVVRRGESSDHTVRFDRIVKLIVKPYQQPHKIYE